MTFNSVFSLQVARVVGEECGKLYQSQKQNPDTQWSVPENFQLSLEDVSGEVKELSEIFLMLILMSIVQIVVSGVYLRLFVANPGWVLRKPKQFMEVRLTVYCYLTVADH